MRDLKITVITPTYNRANTLPRAFHSLKSQTFGGFKWLIMDDGSTDETAQLIKDLIKEAPFEIEYFHHSNRHKFHTVFEGIRKAKTPYFTILDSDDSYPADALEILMKEAEKIKVPDDYISVMGLSGDENGEVVGDLYPKEFDGSIFDMRYKYKVKGDKNGIFFTRSYLRELEKFDATAFPEGIYIPQSVFFNNYDAGGLKTRFINKIIRTYHKDEEDAASVSNTRAQGKNRLGLMLGYLSFLNAYGNKLYSYPKVLIRNLAGYQIYAIESGKSLAEINRQLKRFKFLSSLLYIISFLYVKLRGR